MSHMCLRTYFLQDLEKKWYSSLKYFLGCTVIFFLAIDSISTFSRFGHIKSL